MLLVLARALPVFATTLLGCAAPKPADDAAGATPVERSGRTGPLGRIVRHRPLPAPACPPPEGLPGVRPEHATLAYWQARTPDAVLLDAAGVAAHTAALAAPGPPDAAADVFVPEPVETTVAAIRERLTFMRARIASGEHVDGAGGRPPSGSLRRIRLRSAPWTNCVSRSRRCPCVAPRRRPASIPCRPTPPSTAIYAARCPRRRPCESSRAGPAGSCWCGRAPPSASWPRTRPSRRRSPPRRSAAIGNPPR
jgi:hypothetical protein